MRLLPKSHLGTLGYLCTIRLRVDSESVIPSRSLVTAPPRLFRSRLPRQNELDAMLHGWGSIWILAANMCEQLHCQRTHLPGYAHCFAVDSASIVVMNGGDFIQCFLVQYILLIQRLYDLRISFVLSD